MFTQLTRDVSGRAAAIAALLLAVGLASTARAGWVASDPVFWLRADEGVSNNPSGDFVWADQTPNGHDARQSTSGYKPTQAVSGAMNNQPVVRFNGSDQFLAIDDHAQLDIGTAAGEQATIFMAYHQTTSTAPASVPFYIVKASNAGSGGCDWLIFTAPSALYWGTGSSSDSGAWMSVPKPSNATPHLLTVDLDQTAASAGVKNISVDGQLPATKTYAVKNPAVGNPAYIGGWFSGSSLLQPYGGDMGEIIFYDRLVSGRERAATESYLHEKYIGPIQPDVLGLWQFNEKKSGSADGPILDSSGHGRHMTASGSPLPVYIPGEPPGLDGSALDFGGGSNRLSLDDTAASGEPADAFDFGADDSFTLEALVRVEPGQTGAIMAKHIGGHADPSWWLRVEGGAEAGQVGFLIWDLATSAIFLPSGSGKTIDDGSWHHVAAVRDADDDQLRLYIDYDLAGSAADTTTGSLANDIDLTIGDFQNDWAPFGGDVDFVRISGEALRPLEFYMPMVPEPTTVVLLAIGVVGLFGSGRLRRRSR